MRSAAGARAIQSSCSVRGAQAKNSREIGGRSLIGRPRVSQGNPNAAPSPTSAARVQVWSMTLIDSGPERRAETGHLEFVAEVGHHRMCSSGERVVGLHACGECSKRGTRLISPVARAGRPSVLDQFADDCVCGCAGLPGAADNIGEGDGRDGRVGEQLDDPDGALGGRRRLTRLGAVAYGRCHIFNR